MIKKILIITIILLNCLIGLTQGTCASPDGAMLEIAAPPADYNELESNGYCMNGTGSTAWHYMCFTFTPDGGDFDINMGFNSVCVNAAFRNFTLYDNTCTIVGTGLSYTGMTPSIQYTFCVEMRANGGPGCNGFDRVCPYWIDTEVLPIELVDFNCDNNTLNFTTATEVNNDYFSIYSSLDGVNWELRTDITGAGNSNTYKTYSYTDANCTGKTYYKLEQTDYNGKTTDHGVVYCKCIYFIDPGFIIEEYNLLGQRVGQDVTGWKIIKIKRGNNIVYEKIYKR